MTASKEAWLTNAAACERKQKLTGRLCGRCLLCEAKRRESFVYFVGDEGNGKKALVGRFLQFCKVPEMKQYFTGVNYAFARNRRQDADVEQQAMSHVWAFCGSRALTTELCNVENIFLAAKHVTTAVVVIVVDLASSSSALESGIYWTEVARTRIGETYEKLRSRGSKLPEQLVARSRKASYSRHPDKNAVGHAGISLLVAAVNYDSFALQPPETRKVVLKGLRYLAHVNGAHLLCLGPVNQAPSAFLRLLHKLAFHGFEKRIVLENSNQRDPMQSLTVLAGEDCLSDIGVPNKNEDPSDITAGLTAWKNAAEQILSTQSKHSIQKKHEEPQLH